MRTPLKSEKDFNLEFNAEVQRYLLSCLIGNPTAFALCRNILMPEYFEDTLRPAVRFVLEYADENRDLPDADLIRGKAGVALTPQDIGESPQKREWLLKEIESFCRYKALELAILEGVELLKKGNGAEIEKRVRDAMTISLVSELGMDYFSDPHQRLERLKDKSAYVSTGWETLDNKLYGGFTRGGLNVFAGGSGSGKSLVLQNLALNWAFMGYHVVYITLELSEELVALRLDAMVTGRGTSEVLRKIDESAYIISMRGKQAGSLTVKKLPEGGTTSNDLRAYLKEYEIKRAIKPDALIVDYLDLLYPNNRRIDASDLFTKDKFVSEELRGLMHETNTFGATASQLNRTSVQTMEFDHSHIAGGISKINTADNVFGLLATPAMKERGIYEIQFLKTRSSSAVGSKIELAYNNTSMRITDPPLGGFDENPEKPMSMSNLKQQVQAQIAASQTQPPAPAPAQQPEPASTGSVPVSAPPEVEDMAMEVETGEEAGVVPAASEPRTIDLIGQLMTHTRKHSALI